VTGSSEYGNETLGSIKCGKFLDYLRTVSSSRRTLLHRAILHEFAITMGLAYIYFGNKSAGALLFAVIRLGSSPDQHIDKCVMSLKLL
jgi:hypothetical protein